jgi:hypothetical protein
MSHRIQATWNPLEPLSESISLVTGGAVLLGNTHGEDSFGRKDVAIVIASLTQHYPLEPSCLNTHTHLTLLRVGHLKELFHIFANLKAHHNTEMVFNSTPVEFNRCLFERQDWSISPYGYEGLTEDLPFGMPTPHGPTMTKRVYLDSNHGGDLVI